MPGGLELAQTGAGAGAGADPFTAAIDRLRVSGISLQPSALDMFAMRADPAAKKLWEEAKPRLEEALEQQRVAGQRSLDQLEHPPIDRSIPWLKFASGMMKPTRTGAFGESLGAGIEGLASGFGDVNKSELDFAHRAAETGYGVAKDRTKGLEEMYGMGLRADQIDAAMAMMRMRQQNQQLTPAMKEWAAKNKIDTMDPGWIQKLTPEQTKDLERFVLLARGSTQQKNAWTMLNPSDPNYANMVKLLSNQQMMKQIFKMAEDRHPMSAYQGQDVGVRNSAIDQEITRLMEQHAIGQNAGTPVQTIPPGPGGPSLPTPAPGGPAPAPAAAGPMAAPGAPSPAAPAAAGPVPALGPQDSGGPAVHPFDDFMKAPQFSPNRAGQIQSEQVEAAQKAAAQEGEKRASDFITKTVHPGVQAADELRTSAIIAKGLLDKDPKLTGSMKPFMAEFSNFLTTLGLAPERAQTFATNQSLFQSQAMLQVLAKQLEQKGVQTESDAKRIMQAGIDPAKPADANRFMVRYMEAAADRMAERAAFFQRWANRHNTQMAGAVEAWNSYQSKNPMARVVDGKVHFRKIALPED